MYNRKLHRRKNRTPEEVLASMTPEQQEKHKARLAKRRQTPSYKERKTRYVGKYAKKTVKTDFLPYFIHMLDERKLTNTELAEKLHRDPKRKPYHHTWFVYKEPYWYRYDIPIRVFGFLAWLRKGIARGHTVTGNGRMKKYKLKKKETKR